MGFDDEKSQQQAHGPHHLILSKRANQPKIQIEKFRTEEDQNREGRRNGQACGVATEPTIPSQPLGLSQLFNPPFFSFRVQWHRLQCLVSGKRVCILQYHKLRNSDHLLVSLNSTGQEKSLSAKRRVSGISVKCEEGPGDGWNQIHRRVLEQAPC